MTLVNDDQIKPIIARFEQAWCNLERPWIADYLLSADDKLRDRLLFELIPIDISHRYGKGERPRPGDYLQLGPDAVAIAFQELHETFDRYDESHGLDATAFDKPDEPIQHHSDRDIHVSGDTYTSEDPLLYFDNAPSEFIGPYKLLQPIGEGGMGTVWMAEQQKPVIRRVALKVIRADIGNKVAVARFEAERQAIALMDHQNIAKILDAGTTETGHPYFVMELVNGIPLNKYCDNRKLDIRSRLELIVPVCRAIQHAHQKGIIHRDLKHSNVLVTQYDGVPVPKIIDFGLAKDFEKKRKLTDKTLFTEFGKVVGTVQYMSPEQAEMDAVDVDTRSDIYSIGVMIYKLLTGTTPLANERVESNSLLKVLEFIREDDPQKPSSRLNVLSDSKLVKIATKRDVKPDKLKQHVQGDLDWIVMKALEKDRNRRYQTANGLALDIERYLNDEEVRARPPSTFYRVQKLYSRNKRVVIAMLAITFALMLGIIGTSAGLIWALNERDESKAKTVIAAFEERRANQARIEAQRSKAKAEAGLHAIRTKTAWSDWQLGNIESAWQMLNSLNEDEYGWESLFLKSEFTSSKNILYGHAMKVVSMDATSDGSLLVTASQENVLRVWNGKTKKLMFSCKLRDTPEQVRFSKDGKSIVCVDRSNVISIVDSRNGHVVSEFGPYAQDIKCVEFSSTGAELFAGFANEDTTGINRNQKSLAGNLQPKLVVLSIADGETIQELVGHKNSITSIACSGDDRFMVSCSPGEDLRIWQKQINGYVELAHWDPHSHKTLDVAISLDGSTIATCGKDRTVKLWSTIELNLLETLIGHDDNVTSVTFSTNGKNVASSSLDGTARVWSISGEQLLMCRGHFDAINEVCFFNHDNEIVTASDDKTARVWDASTKPSTVSQKVHTDVVWAASVSPDGRQLVTCSEDGSLSFLDLETGHQLAPKMQQDKAILAVTHSPTQNIFVTGSAESPLSDEPTGKLVSKIRIYDAKTYKLVYEFAAHEEFIWDVCFSPDGRFLASASSDSKVKIWNSKDWTLVKSLEAHSGELGSVRYSSDGKYFVTASDDKSVKLWDAKSFALLHTFEGHRNTVWRAVFSPDNGLIASSSFDGEVIVWDVLKRRQQRTINAHRDQIAGLAFSKDGKRIVSASDDQTIKIWDVQSGIELFVLRDKGDSAIVTTAFSPDGNRLISGNQEGYVTIRTANPASKNEQPLLPHDAIEIVTDGLLAVTSDDVVESMYEHWLHRARNCALHFPGYRSLTVVGIAEYRLGRFAESIEALEYARRLEPLEYGEPDVRPNIEGYLALAYLKKGQLRQAMEMKQAFDEKRNLPLWQNDELATKLHEEILEAIASGEN